MAESAAPAPSQRSLRRGVSIFLSGNVVYIGTQFLMLVVLARLTNTATVGAYALALAITAPIFSLASLKLREVHISDAARFNRPSEYFALRALTSAAALIASTLIALPMSPPVTRAVLAVAVFKAIESQLEVTFGTLQRVERLHSVARLQGFRGTVGLALFVGALWLGAPLWAAVLCMASATAAALIASLVIVRRMGHEIRASTDWTRLRHLARRSAPLGVSVAIASLAASAPRYFLEAFQDTGQVGIFAALAYFLLAPATLATAISEVAMPRLANLSAEGKVVPFLAQLRRLVLTGLVIGVTFTVGSLLLGRLALDLLFGPQYAEAWRVLVVLFAGATLQYGALYIGTAAQALQLFSVQVSINVAGLVALTIGCIALIPAWGLMGAAVSIAVANAVQAAMYGRLLTSHVAPTLNSRSDSGPSHAKA